MTTNFVTLNKQSFIEWADNLFGSNYSIGPVKNGRELVIVNPTTIHGLEVHIYTTLDDSEQTRKKGSDAIRCVLFDNCSNKPVGKTKKVLRTVGKTTIWQRMENRIDLLYDLAREQSFCDKCDAHLVERKNKETNEVFFGCSAFPHCGDAKVLNEKYPVIINKAEPELIESEYETDKESIKLTDMDNMPDFIEIVDQDKCTPTSEYSPLNYSFEYFNRVQSAIFQNGLHEKDNNLVLGTTTSSGKTIAAELFMGETLRKGGKVVYCSPLKSLTQEKYEVWSKTFADYKICILTGDYTLTKKREQELNEAEIICVTSEMLDSRTRNYNSERSEWMFDVRLVIVDESHIISTERGHAVEVGLARFCSLVSSARILLLSATMPNVLDFQLWLTNLNGKRTEVINSSWRPTELEWNFIPHLHIGKYWEIMEDKLRLAEKCVMEKPDEKYLVFVHDKSTGRRLESNLKNKEIKSCFHNADLNLNDRLTIEKSFENKNGGLRVLISTSTLAWGRSLPARNVVIVGTTRGINTVDELDIIQMGGRAGRFGIDPKGDVYFLNDNCTLWNQKVKNPRKVLSTLMDTDLLGFHILAEVKNKVIYNLDTLYNWFDFTLAKIQEPINSELVDTTLEQLKKWGMLYEDDGRFSISSLGMVSATLYYMPRDVYHWKMGFNYVNKKNLWNSDLALSYVIGTTPSTALPYVPRSEQERVQDYNAALTSIWGRSPAFSSVHAVDLYDKINGRKTSPAVRSLTYDIERMSQAWTWMDGICHWSQPQIWSSLPLRIQHGVGAELIELCSLPSIGASRAKKLFSRGFKNRQDLLKNKTKLAQIIGKKTSEKVIHAILHDE